MEDGDNFAIFKKAFAFLHSKISFIFLSCFTFEKLYFTGIGILANSPKPRE